MFSAMASLGLFVFGLQTLPYQALDRTTDWRWPSNARVGARPARQYLGVGDDVINLNGTLMPEITGGRVSLGLLRYMADTGKAWPFVQGNGYVLGMYVIESMQEGQTLFFPDGTPRQITFSVKLTKVDEAQYNPIGDILGEITPQLIALL